MNVDQLNTIGNIAGFQSEPVVKDVPKTDDSLFDSFYNAAISTLSDTNQLQQAADTIQQDFASGATDDILAVMMAQQKASTSLNFTVQVTNKLISAYQEIMRIQI